MPTLLPSPPVAAPMRELTFENGRAVGAEDPREGYTCDGCGEPFDDRPEHVYEGTPFRTYCSDDCLPEHLKGGK